MPAPSWENLDDFLATDDDGGFAVVFSVTLYDGTVRSGVRGIYDDPYLNTETGEYEVDTTAPRLLCKEADLVGVRRYSVVTLDGKQYDVVTNPQPDGTGMSTLKLAEVQQNAFTDEQQASTLPGFRPAEAEADQIVNFELPR